MSRKRHRNFERSIDRLHRRAGKRATRSSILIVCEGSKTEPKYFERVLAKWKLATVEVLPARGSAPTTIVADAAWRKKARRVEASHSNVVVEYDEVWCVFDVDAHPRIKTAIKTADENGINVALTNPCFEFWLLLHFVRFGTTNQNRHQVQKELRQYIPGYEKGGDYVDAVFNGIGKAITRAEHILASQWQVDPEKAVELLKCNPSTAVHLVMKKLRSMAPV